MTGDTGIHEHMIGDAGGQGAVSALAIVSAELMETIRNAHLALEDCVDGRGGTTALTRAGELLHQAAGALRMTETYGAALLVEEMELTCRYLSALRSSRGREDGLDALTRSMVQLPIYIERLLAGGRDIALVLLPMLNDLRAARGCCSTCRHSVPRTGRVRAMVPAKILWSLPNGCGRSSSWRCLAGSRVATANGISIPWARLRRPWRIRQRATTCTSCGG